MVFGLNRSTAKHIALREGGEITLGEKKTTKKERFEGKGRNCLACGIKKQKKEAGIKS